MKTFDSIAMKRQAAIRVYEALAKMSKEQQLDYWREHTRALRQLQQHNRERQAPRPDAPAILRAPLPRGKKPFDCVEMKHHSGDVICEEIKDMSPEEQRAYWRDRTRQLRARQQALRQQSAHDAARDESL